MIVTTEAIILKARKFKESSKLLTCYTHDYGKLTFVANGARRISKKGGSRFGSALDALSVSMITFQKKEGRDLHTLMSADHIQSSLALQDHYSALTTAFAVAESILSTQLEEQAHSEIFSLTKETIMALHATTAQGRTALIEPSHYEAIQLCFYIRLAGYMGFALHPDLCPLTHSPITPDMAEYFTVSLADGAPYHPRIAGLQHGFRMGTYSLEALQSLAKYQPSTSSGIPLTPYQAGQLHEFLGKYFLYHCERHITPRTDAFLRESV